MRIKIYCLVTEKNRFQKFLEFQRLLKAAYQALIVVLASKMKKAIVNQYNRHHK